MIHLRNFPFFLVFFCNMYYAYVIKTLESGFIIQTSVTYRMRIFASVVLSCITDDNET